MMEDIGLPPGHGSRISHATLARRGEEGVGYLGESYGKWRRARALDLERLHHVPCLALHSVDRDALSAS